MIIRKKTREISKRYVNRKLILKLRRLAAIFLIIILVIAYDIFKDIINPALALAGIGLGVFIGSIVGKYSNIHWHEETSTVISRWNKISIAVLIIYIAFAASKKWIFGHWLHGSTLTAFSFSLAAGVMTGRIASMRKQIRKILREKGYLSP